ncbi:DUF4255 domain-containing protein [Mucilaginibacter sp. HMF5004]|uniref:DUF4255 domain-containing protein n=1 Tax=Mucilaginibacter rivuli TaxID=2857527 RepID=UPI001C5F24A3|nr:DUF4255 domain-containing protein [Mucilaginibacter rivuli]MBW4891600.1 DUF4255 domain-containing protein [Mucilaginibacter rivuli]
MIYESLSCLTDEINQYFKNKLKTAEDAVVLSGIINQDGTVAIQGENKIVVTLVNVEKEVLGSGTPGRLAGNIGTSQSAPLNINLYVLFSAYFKTGNYSEALRFLSFVVAYFQYKNVFTQANTPKLDAGIDKLIFEMASISPEQLNNIWASLGAKYMPSVVYKMRMLTFDESIIKEYRPVISDVNGNSGV